MGFALSLRSDNASALAVVELWDRVGAFEDMPSMRALDYPPHLTLAIYDTDEMNEQAACAAVAQAAVGRAELRITFGRIRAFQGPPLVLWLDPEPQEPLLRLHSIIHAKIDPTLCRSCYRPGQWIPHCTLGTRIRDERNHDALAFAESFRGGLQVQFDAMDCMAFPPLRLVTKHRLASEGQSGPQ